MRRKIFATATLFLAPILFAIVGLSDFVLTDHEITEHRFSVDGSNVEGSLVLPRDCSDYAVAVLVHGDGPQDRWSNETYLPFINTLAASCIGVFSWDKPGVGKSSGDWLKHSMTDRAKIASAALQYVQKLLYIESDRVGFIGFSQAGWVIPIVLSKMQPSFSVLVGPAVNWRAQGAYYTRTKLQHEGYSAAEIDKIVVDKLNHNDTVFGLTGKPTSIDAQKISKERFGFVQLNYSSDARHDIAKMQSPVLALWGEVDLNVNPVVNHEIYNQLLKPDHNQHAKIIADATHGLLRSRWFNYQTTAEWPAWAKGLFVCLGRRAYVAGSIGNIADWINNTL